MYNKPHIFIILCMNFKNCSLVFCLGFDQSCQCVFLCIPYCLRQKPQKQHNIISLPTKGLVRTCPYKRCTEYRPDLVSFGFVSASAPGLDNQFHHSHLWADSLREEFLSEEPNQREKLLKVKAM